MGMNAKQEAFVYEYAKSGDTIDAYLAAGYKSKSRISASRAARRLLERPEIQEKLKELHEEMKSERIANASEVQERLTRILRLEETEDMVIVEGCGDGVSEAKVVSKRPALKDVIKAGETLAKMQGAFDTKVDVSVLIPKFSGEDELKD